MKHIFTWKLARKLLIGTVAFITLIALVWAVENYRGKRAWKNYRAELEAKGEPLTLEAVIPPEVPDDKNFAMAPFFADLKFDTAAGGTGGWEVPPSMKLEPFLPKNGAEAPRFENLVDLKALQEFYRGNTNYLQSEKEQAPAEDVLLALSRFDEKIGGLQTAAEERPFARFPIRYEYRFAALLPHLSALKPIALTLWFRSAAHLELGRTDEAFKDVQLSFRIADTLKQEPLIISHLVRIAVYQINLKMIKEGLARHAWRESDLRAFEKILAEADFLSAHQRAIRGERAVFLDVFLLNRKTNPELRGMSEEPFFRSLRWFPIGWLYQNQKTLAHLHQEYSLGAIDPAKQRVYRDIADAGGKIKWTRHPYKMLAHLAFPAVSKTTRRTAETQTSVNQAILACALERFYLANKRYPERLEELVPAFIDTLPHDVVTGEPLRYERMGEFYTIAGMDWERKGADAGSARHESPANGQEGAWTLSK